MANIVMKPGKKMPEAAKGGGRRKVWPSRFEEVAEKWPGKPVLMAEFDSQHGASRIRTKVRKGVYDVPGGAESWDIRAVMVRDEDTGEMVGSELWVQFAGWEYE